MEFLEYFTLIRKKELLTKEILDIYDDNGNVTGKTIVKGDKSTKINNGEHIALSVIFIENSKNEFLIQKTSLEKGNIYSTTGGRVLSGETPLDTIKRETKEELGIDINNITIQEEEVESVRFMPISEINELISGNKFLESHAIQFQKMLKIKRKI